MRKVRALVAQIVWVFGFSLPVTSRLADHSGAWKRGLGQFSQMPSARKAIGAPREVQTPMVANPRVWRTSMGVHGRFWISSLRERVTRRETPPAMYQHVASMAKPSKLRAASLARTAAEHGTVSSATWLLVHPECAQ